MPRAGKIENFSISIFIIISISIFQNFSISIFSIIDFFLILNFKVGRITFVALPIFVIMIHN